ncbi:MAG: putative LytR family regulatory protein [Propionibacteriaceae bacterium]|nr:putative LytR family regulatory protein [Propionibacteriaceae bacterium]
MARRAACGSTSILAVISSEIPSPLQIERPLRVSINTASTRPVPPPSSTTRRSDRVKLRRGLTFLAMTLVLPGSAQIAAGNRRVGRFAVRVWMALWASLLLVGALTLLWRGGAIAMFTFGPTLRVVQAVMIAVGIGWALLLLDAWRIARPPELARQHRLGFAILNVALVFLVAGGLFASASMVSSQRDMMASVFAGGGDTKSKNGRFNVLLMGGDAGKNRTGLRPDSMTIASIDADTGRTVLFSLPRNMEDVPFPESSPLHDKFPRGFGCADHSCMLNAVYTYATEHAALYPGVTNPGAQATKEAVEGVTGLTINYWALIDLKGFEALVNAVGGITLDINKRVPIGGGSTKISGYIETGKHVQLDGYHALWFARSRADSSDYERMARQKCVMSAMLNQLDPMTVLTKFNQIAAAGKEIVATDIPTSTINTLMQLALKAKKLPISSLSFVPPLVYPGSPNFTVIHAAVQAKIDAAEGADRGEKPAKGAEPASRASSDPSTEAEQNGSSSATAEPGAGASSTPKPGQDTEDLAEVCAAR